MELEALVIPMEFNIQNALGALKQLATSPEMIALLAIAGIVAATKATLDWGNELDSVNDKLGTTSDVSAGLIYAAKGVGLSTDQMNSAFGTFIRGLGTFEKPGKTATALMEELGISAYDAEGNLRPTQDIIQDVSNALTNMPDGLDKSRIATELFGKSGTELNDMLAALSGGGLSTAMSKMSEFGLASDENTQASIEFTKMASDLDFMLKGLAVSIGEKVLPIVSALIGVIIDNKDIIIAALATIFAILLPGPATAIAIGTAFQSNFLGMKDLFNMLLGVVKIVWAYFDTNFMPILTALGNVVGAVINLALKVMAGIWQNILLPVLKVVWEMIKDKLQPVLDVLAPIFEGISNAIKGVVGWLNDLANKINDIKLPSWLTPGSPTPFEMGLWGINDAFKELNKNAIPDFSASISMSGKTPAQPVTAPTGMDYNEMARAMINALQRA